jgi:hypothetical protein
MAWNYENGAAGVIAGVTNWKGAWVTSTLYKIGDGVQNDGSAYVCILEHTSGATTEPGTGASWSTYWSLLASKGDTGSGITDNDAIHDNVSGEINAITAKSALVDNDIFIIEDSEATNVKKKTLFSSIKSVLKIYFDTLYALASHNHSASAINADTLDGDRLPAISSAKKGAVPATGTPSGKFLKDDNTWATPAGGGTGDVVGPATNTDAKIPQWNGANSKTLKDGLGLVTTLGSPGADTNIPSEKAVRAAISAAGGGDVSGPISAVDGNFASFDATTGKLIKDSGSKAADFATSGHNHDSAYTAKNTAITAATKTKITYDSKGLVTAGADATQDDIGDGTTNKQYSATEKTKLSGIETAADVTDAGNVGSSLHGATAKTTMVDADKIAIIDTEASNVLKTLSWAYVKSILKTYFDTLYNLYVHPNHSGDVTSVADGATTIAAKAVTLAKMNDLAQNTIIGRVTASTGVPEALTAANVRTIINVADGATANAKATGAEIDTGTDDAKFATAKAIADSAVSTATKTQTLTNKRITKRVGTTSDAATVTPDADASDMHTITAIAQAFTLANPSGTPTSGQKLIIRIKDNATGRAITWGNAYRAIGVTLPTTTVASKTHYIGCVYNSADSKWDVVAVGAEA